MNFAFTPPRRRTRPRVPAAEASWTLWFVELKSPPAADGASLATLPNEKAAFRREAAQAGVQFKERFAFDTLWNGLSIEVASSQVSKLWRIEGVKNLFGPACRVRVGYDFVGDAFDADPTSPLYNPDPTPDNDPDDCSGHGTHVAGIIGAKPCTATSSASARSRDGKRDAA